MKNLLRFCVNESVESVSAVDLLRRCKSQMILDSAELLLEFEFLTKREGRFHKKGFCIAARFLLEHHLKRFFLGILGKNKGH